MSQPPLVSPGRPAPRRRNATRDGSRRSHGRRRRRRRRYATATALRDFFPTFPRPRAHAPGDDATRDATTTRARETSRQRAFSTDLAFHDRVSRRTCAVRAWRARISRDRIRPRVKPRAAVPSGRRRARGAEEFIVDDHASG